MAFLEFIVAAAVGLVSSAIFFAINGVVLKLASGWLDFDDKSWQTAYKVAGIAVVVSYLLSLIPAAMASAFFVMGRVAAFFVNALFAFVNAVIFVWLIKRFYYQGWGKSILAWLIVFVVNIILGFIVGLIVATLSTAFAFSAAKFV
ncbi:MAG: hypothetical protein QXT19_02625 [Candidatus Woesearchaeota archaeon]